MAYCGIGIGRGAGAYVKFWRTWTGVYAGVSSNASDIVDRVAEATVDGYWINSLFGIAYIICCVPGGGGIGIHDCGGDIAICIYVSDTSQVFFTLVFAVCFIGDRSVVA